MTLIRQLAFQHSGQGRGWRALGNEALASDSVLAAPQSSAGGRREAKTSLEPLHPELASCSLPSVLLSFLLESKSYWAADRFSLSLTVAYGGQEACTQEVLRFAK